MPSYVTWVWIGFGGLCLLYAGLWFWFSAEVKKHEEEAG